MSPTVKENILYVGLILVVALLAVFPMLFEWFFNSRRRSLLEAASDLKREILRSKLKDFSIELTADIFNFLSEMSCNPLTDTTNKQNLTKTASSLPIDEGSVKDTSIASHNNFRLLIPQAGHNVQGLNFKKDALKTLQSLCICSTTTEPNKSTPESKHLSEIGEVNLSTTASRSHSKLLSDEVFLLQHEVTCCLRYVDTSCCICLEPYKIMDIICWSSNPACCHVFHQGCIVDWFMTSNSTISQGNTVVISNGAVRPLHDHFERDVETSGSVAIPNTDATSQTLHHQGGQESANVEEFTCPCCRAPFIDLPCT